MKRGMDMVKRIAILIVLMTMISYGQIETQFGLHTTVDDNVDNNYLKNNDRISSLTGMLSYNFGGDSDNLLAFYNGMYNYYQKFVSHSYQHHGLGLLYEKTYADDAALHAGVSYEARFDRSDYSYLDYGIAVFFVNGEEQLTDLFTGRLGYRLQYLGYSELTELSNIENYFFVNTGGTFVTKTTIIAEAAFGIKSYINAAVSPSTGMNGRGRGMMNSSLSASVMQWSVMGKIGQSVFENTGVSASARYQANVKSEARYFSANAMISDNEIFDSRYGYEGLMYEGGIKQLLPWSMVPMGSMTVTVSVSREEKGYSNRPVYDLAGTFFFPQRNDTRTVYSFGVEQDLENILSGATLSLSYDYLRNDSNDPYYHYLNSALSAQFGYGF
jgi:hypothetical protein